MNLSLKQLQYFNQFSKSENVSKAASLLGVTQPALTVSLRKIETDLEVELFDRAKGQIALNKNGYLLAPQVDRLLNAYHHVCKASQNLQSKDQQKPRICIPHTPWTSSLRADLITDSNFSIHTPTPGALNCSPYDATIVFHFCSHFAQPGYKVTEIAHLKGMCSAKQKNCDRFISEDKHCELLVPTESLLTGVEQMLMSQSADEAGVSTKIIHKMGRYDQIIASAQCSQMMAILPGKASHWKKLYGNLVHFSDFSQFTNSGIKISIVTPLTTKPELLSQIEKTVRSHLA